MCSIKAPNGCVQPAGEVSAAFPGQQLGSAGCRPPLPKMLLAGSHPGPGQRVGVTVPSERHKKRDAQTGKPAPTQRTLCYFTHCRSAEQLSWRFRDTSKHAGKFSRKTRFRSSLFTDKQKNTFVSDSNSVHQPHSLTASISGIPNRERALTFWNKSRGGHQTDEAPLL